LKTLRPAFTLIEILVSVLILSGSIVFVLKIYSQNHEQIVYITERNKHALEDSLFLSQRTLQYHKEEKSAYDLLRPNIKIDKYESRQILEKITRHIYIPEQTLLLSEEDGDEPKATMDEIKLKGEFSSSYFHLNITRL